MVIQVLSVRSCFVLKVPTGSRGLRPPALLSARSSLAEPRSQRGATEAEEGRVGGGDGAAATGLGSTYTPSSATRSAGERVSKASLLFLFPAEAG